MASLTPFNVFSETITVDSVGLEMPAAVMAMPDSATTSPQTLMQVASPEVMAVSDSVATTVVADSVAVTGVVDPETTKLNVDEFDPDDEGVPMKMFNPDPTRAVWLSALFPGLGQIYNRRYWKLPLVVGGFMGIAYGTSWNNGMLRDYTRAYSDLMDADPTTKSYMDFFPPNTEESSLDKNWLQNIMKSRKDFYRRNRDLCIIAMIGVYVLAMVDAYVDASLSHFDISPELTMSVQPAIIPDTRSNIPGLGLQWALNF